MEYEKKHDLKREGTNPLLENIRAIYGRHFRRNNKTGEVDVLVDFSGWTPIGRASGLDIALAGLVPAQVNSESGYVR